MKMKFARFFAVVAVALCSFNAMASNKATIVPEAATAANWGFVYEQAPEIKDLPKDMLQMHLDKFLALTPAKYKEMTGKNLGLKKSMELKAAQKYLKKQMNAGADVSKGLYVVLAILGLGWVAMGILDDWSGSDWIVSLVLSLLCWLPGVIYSLVKMKKYY